MRSIAGAIGAILGAFTIWVLTGNALATIVAGLVGVIVTVLFSIEGLQKTNTTQQTQIDDLKRELEEMKRKQSEPQS